MGSNVIPSIKELNFSDYITLNSGFSLVDGKILQIAPHILFVQMTVSGSILQGQTTIGRASSFPLNTASIISGNVVNPSALPIAPTVYPATGIIIPNGEVRVYSSIARPRAVLMGFVLY